MTLRQDYQNLNGGDRNRGAKRSSSLLRVGNPAQVLNAMCPTSKKKVLAMYSMRQRDISAHYIGKTRKLAESDACARRLPVRAH